MSRRKKPARRAFRAFFGAVRAKRAAVGKGILFGAAAFLCLLPAVYINSLTGYLPILFFVLLAALSAAYRAALGRLVSFEGARVDPMCMRTREQDFRVRIDNRSPLACPAALAHFSMYNRASGSGTDTQLAISLSPFEKREFSYSVTFSHLGQYEVGIRSVELAGPLGFFNKSLPGGGLQGVHVTPRRYHPSQLGLTQAVESEDSQARRSAPVDGMDYTGVREYVPGDPIKHMHWKLSAHGGSYMTKQMEVFGNSGVDVILDLVSPPWEGEDGAFTYDALVECACAAVVHAAGEGMEASLCFIDREQRERKELCCRADDVDMLMDEIPPGVVKNAAEYRLDSLLMQAAGGMYAGSNIVLCTSRMDEDITRRLEQARSRRRNPVVLYVLPPGLDNKRREDRMAAARSLSSRDIPCWMLTDAAELGRGA